MMSERFENDRLLDELKAVLEDSRHFFLYQVTSFLQEEFSANYRFCHSQRENIKISSLSQLRKITGGKFEILKKLWLEAGFPLRDFKGDRSKSYNIDSSGLSKFEKYLNSKGFSIEPVSDIDSSVLFVLSKI